MSSFRAIVVAIVNATACAAVAAGSAGAQACSISSTAPGRVSCSVTTTVRMSLRIPSLVGVAVTLADSDTQSARAAVRAGFSVKTNRSYALQIARAPIDSVGPIAVTRSALPRVVWSTATNRAPLGDAPTQIDARGSPGDAEGPVQVAFASEPGRGVAALDAIRLTLTVVAP